MKASKGPPVWGQLKTQKQWREYYRRILRTDVQTLLHAILKIDSYQTDIERLDGVSIEENKVGWDKNDASRMSAIAATLRATKRLPKEDVAYARLVMPKYWRQLMLTGVKKQEQFVKRQEALEAAQAALKAECEQPQQYKQIELCMETGQPCEYGICSECPNKK